MPRITPYVAPVGNVSESTRGDAAWEQAGRRLGPLYNEAAQFQRQEGALAAQGIKQKIWPYDIARLLETQGHSGGGGGGRLRGGSSSTLADRGTSTGRIGLPDNGGAVNQIMHGAGALGRALGDGGYQLATAKEPEDMTLEGGRLVTSDQSRKILNEYNTMLDKRSSEYAQQLYERQNTGLVLPGESKAEADYAGGGEEASSSSWWPSLPSWVTSSGPADRPATSYPAIQDVYSVPN